MVSGLLRTQVTGCRCGCDHCTLGGYPVHHTPVFPAVSLGGFSSDTIYPVGKLCHGFEYSDMDAELTGK